MNKGIADHFLQEITHPTQEEGDDPRVILVRSNRNLKRFITDALNEVEHLVSLVQGSKLPWQEISERLARLAQLAERHRQSKVDVAAIQIATLARSLAERDESQLDPGSSLEAKFTDFVTYLSTMLLRVYIEGSDEKCTWELASVEMLVAECYSLIPNGRAQWLN